MNPLLKELAKEEKVIESHKAIAEALQKRAVEFVHYVPLGSLIPAGADNVCAAGRCIDADLAALSSVRVMGPCMAMGMAGFLVEKPNQRLGTMFMRDATLNFVINGLNS